MVLVLYSIGYSELFSERILFHAEGRLSKNLLTENADVDKCF